MTHPTISVIIPVYNGAAHLAEAIQSVLAQSLPPGEVIVVDDGSSDGSAQVARGFGGALRCIRQEHAGPAAARNRGVELAGGELLAFLDADDLWTPGKLQSQAEALAAEPPLQAVLGLLEVFTSPEISQAALLAPPGPAQPQAGYHVGALCIRRSTFERVGSFNAGLQSGEFIDWWARARDLGLVYRMLPQVVMRRRLHGGNHTLRRPETLRDYARVARAALERRRRNDPP